MSTIVSSPNSPNTVKPIVKPIVKPDGNCGVHGVHGVHCPLPSEEPPNIEVCQARFGVDDGANLAANIWGDHLTPGP